MMFDLSRILIITVALVACEKGKGGGGGGTAAPESGTDTSHASPQEVEDVGGSTTSQPECTVQADCTGLIGCSGCVCLFGHCSTAPSGPCADSPCEGLAGSNACATELAEVCDGCTEGSGCIPEAACTAFNTPCNVTPLSPVVAPDVIEETPGDTPNGSHASDAG